MSWLAPCGLLLPFSPPTSASNCTLDRQKRDTMTRLGASTDAVCMGMADVALAMVLVTLIVTTVIGNILVVLSIAVYRRMRTFTNVLLVSLATADLLVGLMVMPIALVDQLHRHRWQFGISLCKLWTTTDVLLCTASILNLCVISLDRYFAITAPLRYTRTRSQTLAAAIVAAVWLVSLVISSPPWFVPQWRIQLEDQTCGYAKATAYRVYSAFGSFYIPLFIMLFVYYKIFRVASNREKVLNAERRGSRTMQMWQQQANRRAARNSLAASAATMSIKGVASTASSRSAPTGRSTTRQYDVMQNSDEDDLDRADRTIDRSDRSVEVKRKRTMDSTNSYYRYMNRCDSPASMLKHVKFAGGHFNQQYHQEQRARLRLRFQRTPTEEILDSTPPSTSWRAATGRDATTLGCSSFSDATAGRATTFARSPTSIDCGAVAQPESTGKRSSVDATGRKTTSTSLPGSASQNSMPLLSENARRYFERTVPWSLVRKANEYYANSKPMRPSREKLIYLKERKALKTIGIVVSGFIICWLPFFILYLVEAAFFASAQVRVAPIASMVAPPTTTPVPDLRTFSKSKTANASSISNRNHRGYQSTLIVTLTAAAAADLAALGQMGSRSTSLTTATPWRQPTVASESTNSTSGAASALFGAIPPILADIFLWLGYSNSVLNPLIYTFYNRDFRRCFKDLISCGCLRRNAANRRMSVRRLHQTRL